MLSRELPSVGRRGTRPLGGSLPLPLLEQDMISMRRDRLAPGPRSALRELIPGALCVLVVAYLIHEELTRTVGRPAIARLRHGGEEDRVAACQALGQLTGEEPGAAVPELVAAS